MSDDKAKKRSEYEEKQGYVVGVMRDPFSLKISRKQKNYISNCAPTKINYSNMNMTGIDIGRLEFNELMDRYFELMKQKIIKEGMVRIPGIGKLFLRPIPKADNSWTRELNEKHYPDEEFVPYFYKAYFLSTDQFRGEMRKETRREHNNTLRLGDVPYPDSIFVPLSFVERYRKGEMTREEIEDYIKEQEELTGRIARNLNKTDSLFKKEGKNEENGKSTKGK